MNTDWKAFFKKLGIRVGIEVAKTATKVTYQELEKAIFDDCDGCDEAKETDEKPREDWAESK